METELRWKLHLKMTRGGSKMQKIEHQRQLGKWEDFFMNMLPVIIIYELVLGGSGRVITFGSFLSIRYILFAVSMLFYAYVWARDLWIKKIPLGQVIRQRMNLSLTLTLVFFVLLLASMVQGYRAGYPLGDVFESSKGFLFILMLFPFSLFVDSKEKARRLILHFTDATVILAILSFSIFIIFGIYNDAFNWFDPILTKWSYGYISIRGGFPAVFMKTSPYLAIALIIELGLYINSKAHKSKWKTFRIFILLEAIIGTMSMGIWIATAVGFGMVVILSVANHKYILAHKEKGVFRDLLPIIVVVVLSQLAFNLIFKDYIVTVIDNRIDTDDSSFVVKADQLTKLTAIWKESPLFGKGYGYRIFFDLGDFRKESMILFELFWNQLLLNMGIVGFLAYVTLILEPVVNYIRRMFRKVQEVEDVVFIVLISIGMLIMCIVSSVNPFMNNPIGIGYLALFLSSVNVYSKRGIKPTISA